MIANTTGMAEANRRALEWNDITRRIKKVLVHRLDLPIPAEWVTDDQPLFGRGLELDSLDALELSMAIDQEFGTPIYEENTSLFGSVSAVLAYLLGKAAELTPEDAERMQEQMITRTGPSEIGPNSLLTGSAPTPETA